MQFTNMDNIIHTLYIPIGIICFIIIKKLLLLKYSKVYFHIVQITKYILNNILSKFMVNKKVKQKNAGRSKIDICSLNLTLGWSIRNKISTQWPTGKLNFFMANKESQVFLWLIRNLPFKILFSPLYCTWWDE
jgi:hypothetical protein